VATDPADLGVAEAAALLARRELSASEIVSTCLRRIGERDGRHSFDGDVASINAWARVYEEDAVAAAAVADERLAGGGAPALCGIPVGLKDLYAVAGKPLTASSRVLDEVPERDSEVWARLSAAGMVLLGHLHTHEFAAGGTTDQVGNPWALERSAGGSSGGSAAALAARLTPAATGTDTAGSLRIPSALCGTSTIKPTRGLVSLRGVVPLAASLDHAGPMARTLEDCALLLDALAGPGAGEATLEGARLAVSPRLGLVDLDADVAAAFDEVLALCRRLGAVVVEPPPPRTELDLGRAFLDVLLVEVASWHRRFDHIEGMRHRYRPFMLEWFAEARQRAVSAEAYVALQARRLEAADTWGDWLAAGGVTAVVEPTVPVVAPPRQIGYGHAGEDVALISLTHYWDWTGFPAVAFPAGVGARSGLPVSVSLVGAPGADRELLRLGGELQAELGVPAPPADL
jgi:aspartyl-tRNA(Asn)/glutamyl-tRNA(Gln) amidotransferase subunit A